MRNIGWPTALGAFVMVALLSACANLNPLAVAETPEQKYAAVKLTYDALLTPAVQLVENTAVPNDLRRAMQDAIARSGETYKALNAAYADYVVARETFTGVDRDQRLAVVAASLDGWITQLGQHVDAIAGGLSD
jgi:hypothetical protein